MDRLDYAQGVVLARVYEKRLLDRSKLDRMIDSKNVDEAFKILLDSEYIKSSEGVESVKDYELLLKNETARFFKLGHEMLIDQRVLEILSLKYDYHNLKAIVKGKVSEEDTSNLFIYTSENDPKKIKLQYESGSFIDIKEEFLEALKNAEKKYVETQDPQVIDIEMDVAYYKHFKKISDLLEVDLFDEYVSASIDFFNVTSMLRSIKMGKNINFLNDILVEGGNISIAKLISISREDFEKIAASLKSEKIGSSLLECVDEYNKTGSFSIIDSVKDTYLSNLNSDSKFISFGPEPIFAYLAAKEKEISLVRLILVGKLNNIPSSKIRERMGDI
ncbi:V-type ATP synthase subunit C [Peptostreptococcus faecalis]|uniref:V-type ATP synthase subunit C n=1 Tax=Peptostreptococcus faecalis TaxID=2045015 RepID=UPI000C7C0404|nr:V-type ATP synthase subunit C [Peptostreptococcus faecalis]